MRKLSLRIIDYAILGVVLILGACIKPVGVDDFLKDSRVQDIVGGKEGVKGGIDYKHPVDLKPVLTNDVRPQVEDSRVNLKVSLSEDVTITARPPAGISYDSNIEWFCNGYPLPTGNSIIITAGVGPFLAGEIYQLVVIGTVDGIPYSTWIFIRVEP